MVKDKKKYWDFVEIENEHLKRQHLFLSNLRERNRRKTVDFDTFREYLTNFDVDILDDYNQQLTDLGNDSDIYPIIKAYLIDVKSHSGLFIQLLKDLIA